MRTFCVALSTLMLGCFGWCLPALAAEQSQEHTHGQHRATATNDPACDVLIKISEAAELQLGGALHASPEVEQHSGHSQSMPETQGAHMTHRPRHGGAFFMAPNKMHHLEGVYSDECGFQIFLYSAFTEPIHVNRFQAFVHVFPSGEDELDIIRFLSPANGGTVLTAAFGNAVSRPFQIELYLKFPESDEPQLFNVIVPAAQTKPQIKPEAMPQTIPMPEWGIRAPLIEPNSEMAVAHLDGKIYVVGGYPSTRVSVDTVQVYDIKSDSWRLTTPYPTTINHASAVGLDGVVYVIGGQTSAGGRGADAGYTSVVHAFDPKTETWTVRAPMPTARSGMAHDVIDGKIYVAGGRPPRGHDFAVYDPKVDEWTSLPELPTARNHMAAAAISGKLHVAGGRFGGGFRSEITAVLEVYDPVTKKMDDETANAGSAQRAQRDLRQRLLSYLWWRTSDSWAVRCVSPSHSLRSEGRPLDAFARYAYFRAWRHRLGLRQ